MSGLRIFLQGPGEVKPKQSCIIGCQILLTPTSYNLIILYSNSIVFTIFTIVKKQIAKNKLESDIQTPYSIIKWYHSYKQGKYIIYNILQRSHYKNTDKIIVTSIIWWECQKYLTPIDTGLLQLRFSQSLQKYS